MLGGLATSCGSWIRQLFLALSKGKAETGRGELAVGAECETWAVRGW